MTVLHAPGWFVAILLVLVFVDGFIAGRWVVK